MRVILLFDTDESSETCRWYDITNKLNKKLSKGGWLQVEFCHPKYGEVFVVKEKEE